MESEFYYKRGESGMNATAISFSENVIGRSPQPD
jgi:hypothetical protein